LATGVHQRPTFLSVLTTRRALLSVLTIEFGQFGHKSGQN
jgi:hypothetical protein